MILEIKDVLYFGIRFIVKLHSSVIRIDIRDKMIFAILFFFNFSKYYFIIVKVGII